MNAIERIASGTPDLRICVVGLGYVGLPLAVHFARHFKVTGFDIDAAKINKLKGGIDPLGINSAEDLKEIRFTSDITDGKHIDVYIVAVPTDIDNAKQPDLHPFKRAAMMIADVITAGSLVIIESTVYPGATREVFMPALARRGVPHFIGYSPERIVPGKPLASKGDLHGAEHALENTVKIVSGDTPGTAQAVAALYRRVVRAGVHIAESIEVAEAAKILENTQRDLNIALMNEFSMICDRLGIDTQAVIDAASTKWNFHPYRPGLVGGHCHPPEERITLKVQGVQESLSISEAYARYGARPEGVEILSWYEGSPAFMPLAALTKREYRKGLRFTLGSGRSFTVTDGHTVITGSSGGLDLRAASNVRVGDLIPVVFGVTEDATEAQAFDVDFLEQAKRRPEFFRVRPARGSVAESWGALKLTKREFPRCQNFKNCNYIPLDVFLKLESSGRSPWARSELKVAWGRGNGAGEMPVILHVDADFCRVLGYYVAEGCVTTSSTTRTTRWSFNVGETEEIADLHAVLSAKGITFSTWEDTFCHTLHTKVSGSLFAEAISEVLGCGYKSDDVLPPSALRFDSGPLVRAFLAGMFRGDGWAHCAKGSDTVGFYSVNPRLRSATGDALRRLGIQHSWNPRGWIQIHGGSARVMAPWFLGKKRAALLSSTSKLRASRVWRKGPQGLGLVEVQGIEPVELREVYSAEVALTHSLVIGDGVLTHNCIGVDPYYLAYQAKRVGFHANVILAGRQINDRMGVYVGRQCVKMLMATSRPHNVLILGATFKENCDDLRNSRVPEIIAELREFNVQAHIHDPLVDLGGFSYHDALVESQGTLKGQEFGAIILAVAHKEFLSPGYLEFFTRYMKSGGVLLDVKGVLRDSPVVQEPGTWSYWHL